jgi:magnesium chelatase family protein
MLEGVLTAREYRSWRMSQLKHFVESSEPKDTADLIERNNVSVDAEKFLRETTRRHALSGRSIVRTVGVARTIADMEESSAVLEQHVAEAFGFRLREAAC